MRTVVALVLGLFSGLLVYLMVALLMADFTSAGGPSALGLISFIVTWGVSAFFFRREARTMTKVFARGFLLGAIEWIAMIGVVVVFAGNGVSGRPAHGAPDVTFAGVPVGGGVLGHLTGGLALAMALVCVMGFVVCYFIPRKKTPEQQRPAAPTKGGDG